MEFIFGAPVIKNERELIFSLCFCEQDAFLVFSTKATHFTLNLKLPHMQRLPSKLFMVTTEAGNFTAGAVV